MALKRTDIKSPVTGYIAQRSVQVGETVSPGQSLMAVVPARQMWVNANFKETQLTDVRIGQSVNIISDLYGEKCCVSWSGDRDQYGNRQCVLLITCTKMRQGTGSKIVQRVPVEVSLDPKELMEHPLRIGLSMTATIDTKNEDIAEMPELASTVTSMPAYTSKAFSYRYQSDRKRN
ncbi:efflux RND transporter periplasmic adaptor subunit [Escherichia coli]